MTPLARDLRAIEAPGTGGTMLRWGTAGIAVATAYAGALWLALAMPPPEGVEGERQETVMIELEPLTALEDAPPPAPEPASPKQAAAEPAPAPAEPVAPPRPPPPEPEPVQEPEPAPEATPARAVAEAPPRDPPMPDAPAAPPRPDPAPAEEPEPPPRLDPTTDALVPDMTQTSAIDAAVLNPPIPSLKPPLPPRPPKAERAPKPRSERPSRPEKPRRSVERPKAVETRRAIAAALPAARSTAAPRSDTRAASRASQAPRVSAASWQRRAVSHFRKFRRRMGSRESGTARVAVTIDRGGRVVGARLAASSGSPSLDGEALALVRRASPIPPPPDGLGGRTLSLTVPVSM